MKTLRFLYIIMVVAAVLVSCGGEKKAVKGGGRYERKPIAEVTQEELALESMLIDAVSQQEIGNRAEALSIYRKCIGQSPETAVAWYEAGRLLLSMGRVDSALYYTQRACEIDGENVWYLLQRAKICELKQDTKGMIGTWEEIVRQHPTVLDYYYNLSNAYIKGEDVSSAIDVLNRFEKRYGVVEEVSLHKQRLWMYLGKPDKAREELEKLASAVPNDVRYNALLAEGYMQEKNYKKALQYYNNILEHHADDENVHVSLAQCYRQMGDYRQTYEHLRAGLRHPAVDCKSRVMFAGEMLREEKFFAAYSREVFLLLDTLLAECPATAGHCYGYGIMLASQERYEEAAEQFRRHLTVDSSQYDTWESLMYCVNRLPNHDEELFSVAQRASRLFPMHIRPYYIQAVILHSKEGYEGALQLLQRCENLGFSRGELQMESYYLTADCYTRMGDTAKALPYYEKALRLAPEDPYLLNSYAYTLAEAGRELGKAAEMARKALKVLPNEASLLDTYAWILFRQGDCKEALVQMEKSIANMKEESETLRAHYKEIKERCGGE